MRNARPDPFRRLGIIRAHVRRSSDVAIPEFTLKAVFTGVVLGIVFGAANAYLGLRVGMTVSASIPAAVMTVAAFRVFRADGTILEANLSQTIAAASTSLATGVIFTIPALFLWGMIPPYLQVVALAFLGGILGLSAMIPLRRLLIVEAHEELPYPEGTACAEVLRATTGDQRPAARRAASGSSGGWRWGRRSSCSWRWPSWSRTSCAWRCRSCRRPSSPSRWRPPSSGVGYILGYRTAAVCVSGALISAVTLTPLIAWLGAGLPAPLFPETERLVSEMTADDIWSRYVRYIGAGAVATAGILTVVRGLPTMAGAFTAVVRGMRQTGGRRRRPGASAPSATCRPGSWSAGSAWWCSSPGSCPGSSPATWPRSSGPSSPPGSASSASSSSPSPRGSWASSASPRSPRRGSPW